MSNELTIEKLRHYAATEIMGMELCGNYYRVNKSTYVFSVHPDELLEGTEEHAFRLVVQSPQKVGLTIRYQDGDDEVWETWELRDRPELYAHLTKEADRG